MHRDRGALGERLELQLVDGRTGRVKRHLVVMGGTCYDLDELSSLVLETQQLLNRLILKELSRRPE